MNDEEFVFAPHEMSLSVEGKDIVLSTVTPACDFCLDTRVVWEYPCARFVIEELQFGSDDNWLACERCAALIEEVDFERLAARSIRSWNLRHGEMSIGQEAGMRDIQWGFSVNRNGERFLCKEADS